MRDANLGWMCQRAPGREREGHGGCSQHWNGGRDISCLLQGPRNPGGGSAGGRPPHHPQPRARLLARGRHVRSASVKTPGYNTRVFSLLAGLAQMPAVSSEARLGGILIRRELRYGSFWGGRSGFPSRVFRGATVFNYCSVCSIRTQHGCCVAVLISASCFWSPKVERKVFAEVFPKVLQAQLNEESKLRVKPRELLFHCRWSLVLLLLLLFFAHTGFIYCIYIYIV